MSLSEFMDLDPRKVIHSIKSKERSDPAKPAKGSFFPNVDRYDLR